MRFKKKMDRFNTKMGRESMNWQIDMERLSRLQVAKKDKEVKNKEG